MIDRDEFSAWLRVPETPGVGREAARALLASFGSPDAVLAASTAARGEVVPAAVASALAAPPEPFEVRLAAGWKWLQAGAEPRDAIALGDPRYPAALLASPDPPLLLYARGRIELLRSPAIAIVGSRNTTAQGLENARAFSADLSNVGWTVVSGLALGIDAAAHEGALAGGGTTIAVVGTDHRPARRRRGPRGVRDSRLDPLATIARLPCPDQARRQVGRQRRRHR